MSRKPKDRSVLEGKIGHTFAEQALLERALTHISAISGGAPQNRSGSYQRLEFLGDHVLGLVVSEMLYQAYPRANEGELSQRLADLVRKETCAEVGREMDLGSELKLGTSESHAGGRARLTILGDACEALIGAVFLDGGYEAMLQEWAQARGLPTPSYSELARTGPQHNPKFRVAVTLPNRSPAEGVGSSKRAAEQAAAAEMLLREGVATDKPDD
jgi:ribonuclease-3